MFHTPCIGWKCSAHLTQIQIAKSYGVSKATVSNAVKAYVDGGIQAITSIKRNPKSNVRRKADGRAEAEIVRIACGPAPEGRCRWTLRLLEKQVRLEFDEPIGRETIRRVLKKRTPSPHEWILVHSAKGKCGFYSAHGGYPGYLWNAV